MSDDDTPEIEEKDLGPPVFVERILPGHRFKIGPIDPATFKRDAKPLHVRVAEALGWLALELCDDYNRMDMNAGPWWRGYAPYEPGRPAVLGEKVAVLCYDTDWSATGPLIERFAISLYYREAVPGWRADADFAGGDADTPLGAVCALILNAAAAGTLPRL